MLSRIRINAFRVELVGGSYEDLLSEAAACVVAESAVGNAIYMLPSFYNHDCGKILFIFINCLLLLRCSSIEVLYIFFLVCHLPQAGEFFFHGQRSNLVLPHDRADALTYRSILYTH